MSNIYKIYRLFPILFFLGFFSEAQNLKWTKILEKNLKAPKFKADTFNIADFGAKQNNQNFLAFKNAISACSESGGGIVLVPKGVWLTGPIHLKSNVNLHVNEGATISFSEQFQDYLPVVLIQRGGYYCYNYSPPIYAKNCQNVALTGNGVIDGNGHVWWPWKKKQPGMVELFKMGKAGVPIEKRKFGKPEYGVRPPFVQFIKCTNVYLDGPTFIDGPSWMIHPVQCDNVIIRNIAINSHGPNNDGIDLDMCKNVLVENCLIDAGDDNIAIKSGRDEEAWKIGKPSENIMVRNCKSLQGHGGFVIGSEMSAGVKNVLVENCSFNNTHRGIRIKTRLGRGGYIEDILIKDITMQNIKREAIIINMQYNAEPIERKIDFDSSAQTVPKINNINIENVRCDNATHALKILGLGQNVLSGISLKKIDITSQKGIKIDNASEISIEKLKLKIEKGKWVSISKSNEISIKCKDFPKKKNSDWYDVKESNSIGLNNIKL